MIQPLRRASPDPTIWWPVQHQLAEKTVLNCAESNVSRPKLDEALSEIPRLEEAAQHFEKTEWTKQLGEQQRLSKDKSIITQGRQPDFGKAAEAVEVFAGEDVVGALRGQFRRH